MIWVWGTCVDDFLERNNAVIVFGRVGGECEYSPSDFNVYILSFLSAFRSYYHIACTPPFSVSF